VSGDLAGRGRTVGARYALREPLWRGRGASAWLAYDTRVDATVTLELVDPEARGGAAAEDRRLDTLAGANVARPVARGEAEDGSPFVVYERSAGESLAERVGRGPLELPVATAIGVQVANALASAHRAGLVHRGLTPAAVVVGAGGRVTVAGFGAPGAGSEADAALLGDGVHLAPEEVRGLAPDSATDVYRLAVILFELLAGAPPFRGGDLAETAGQHLRAAPPMLPAVGVEAPVGLSALLASCLAKEPAARPDATTVRDGLRTVLGALPESTDPVVRRALDTDDPTDDHPLPPAVLPAAEPMPEFSFDDATPVEDLPPRRASPDWLETAPYHVPASARRDAGPMRWLAIVALVAALVVVAVILSRGYGSSDTSATTTAAATTAPATVPAAGASSTPATTAPATTAAQPSKPLAVESIGTFDPRGDGAERDEEAPNAIDGDPSSFWESETYHLLDDLTQSKGGVGLILTLAAGAKLRALEVTTPAPGFSLALYTSRAASQPTTLAGWQAASAARIVTSGTQRFALPAARPARFVLLWFSKLAPASTGKSDYSVRIAEIRAFS
jgi:eukaryotic-like serine/threonine-protein kinase